MKFDLFSSVCLFSLSLSFFSFGAKAVLDKPFNGDEISSEHSDHIMVSRDVDFNHQKLTLATWNSWARGARSGFSHIPAYKDRTEPDVERRTNENADRVKKFLSLKPNSFLALQEWNVQDINKLNMPANFNVLHTRTGDESFNHALVYNTNQFAFVNSSSSDLNDLNTLQSNAVPSQKDRYLHGQFKHIATGQVFDVVCVHLKWGLDATAIRTATTKAISTSNNFIIMGDFNADLSHQSVPGAAVEVSVNGSQTSNGITARMATNDAIIYKVAQTQPLQTITTVQIPQQVLPPKIQQPNGSTSQAGSPSFKTPYETYCKGIFPEIGASFREYNKSSLTESEILKVLFPNVPEGQYPDQETATKKFVELTSAGRPYAKLFKPPSFKTPYEAYFEKFLPEMGASFREYNESPLTDSAILKVLFPDVPEGQYPDQETATKKFVELASAGRPYAKLFKPPSSAKAEQTNQNYTSAPPQPAYSSPMVQPGQNLGSLNTCLSSTDMDYIKNKISGNLQERVKDHVSKGKLSMNDVRTIGSIHFKGQQASLDLLLARPYPTQPAPSVQQAGYNPGYSIQPGYTQPQNMQINAKNQQCISENKEGNFQQEINNLLMSGNITKAQFDEISKLDYNMQREYLKNLLNQHK